jgi:hypothetical protein
MTQKPALRVEVGARVCTQVKKICEVVAKRGVQVACEYEWESDRKIDVVVVFFW